MSARLKEFCGRTAFDKVARIRMSLGEFLLVEHLLLLCNSPLPSFYVAL